MADYDCNTVETTSLTSLPVTHKIADNRQPSVGLTTMIAIDGVDPRSMEPTNPKTPFIGQVVFTLSDSTMHLINSGKSYAFCFFVFLCF